MARRAPGIPLGACGYNTIQELDEGVEEARGNVEAELMRRNDLIPNLVATMDEAAAFEERTFTQVAEARSGLTESRERLEQAVQGDASLEELSAASASGYTLAVMLLAVSSVWLWSLSNLPLASVLFYSSLIGMFFVARADDTLLSGLHGRLGHRIPPPKP